MSLHTADYDFYLPDKLIARHPTERRDGSRMLVVDRGSGTIHHQRFMDLPAWVEPHDLAVLNDTKVLPARLYSDDGEVELLVLDPQPSGLWSCMVKPGRKMKCGREISVGNCRGVVRAVAQDGTRSIQFTPIPDLQRLGKIPLPPYLNREATDADIDRYQTVYASTPGAVAAPTAGLHFTPELLAATPHVFLTLHVGAGTFLPVKVENLTNHKMHSERYVLSQESAQAINRANSILAVGTTTVRVLESCAVDGKVAAGAGETSIFIHPPHQFQIVDKLLTNFHLPKSTLLMLVSAFAGSDLILQAYAEAVQHHYRFYSYGDCMLVI